MRRTAWWGGVAVLLSGCGALPPAETLCYRGDGRLLTPDGAEIGVGGNLLRRTTDPEAGRIVEEMVEFDSPLGQPPSAHRLESVVEGNGFRFETDGASGEGTLEGEAWGWNAWRSEIRLPDGMRVTAEETRTADGITGRQQVMLADGGVVLRVETDLRRMDCDGFETLREAALAGELHAGDGSADAPLPPCEACREEEVEFDAGGRVVRGTLCRPLGEGPAPAVLLLAGSGPTDRDWNNAIVPGANGSARLFAHALAEHGYASLRFDKLGTGTTDLPADVLAGERSVGPQDYFAEQEAALRRLREDPGVRADRVFVAGSSEGGLYALRLAEAAAADLAGVVLLAGVGRTERDLLIHQITGQMARLGTYPPEELERVRTVLGETFDRFAADGTLPDPAALGLEDGLLQFLAAIFAPAGRDLARWILAYDPAATFARFDLPVLILQGEKDIQVDPELDARRMLDAARAAGRTGVELVLLPESDHVFKLETAPRESLGEAAALAYNAPGRTLDPAAVRALLEWLDARVAPASP